MCDIYCKLRNQDETSPTVDKQPDKYEDTSTATQKQQGGHDTRSFSKQEARDFLQDDTWDLRHCWSSTLPIGLFSMFSFGSPI